jgi:hypothetical protein
MWRCYLLSILGSIWVLGYWMSISFPISGECPTIISLNSFPMTLVCTSAPFSTQWILLMDFWPCLSSQKLLWNSVPGVPMDLFLASILLKRIDPGTHLLSISNLLQMTSPVIASGTIFSSISRFKNQPTPFLCYFQGDNHAWLPRFIRIIP